MRARRTTIAASGTTISLLEWTPPEPSGRTLLLLHGGAADSAELSWGGIGAALADAGHRVLAPDHPGFGQSPPAVWPPTQERLVGYVGDLVDALRLDDYAIAGLSLGGGMTLGHLLAQPGRARGAIALDTYGIMPRRGDGSLGRLSHVGAFVLLRTGMLAAVTRSYGRSARAMERALRDLVRNPASRTPELLRAVVSESTSGNGLASFGRFQRDQVMWGRLRTDYTSQLASIRTPTLLIHGERDTAVPLERARAAAALLPRGDLVTVPDAGHWVQRDRPDLVVPAMLGFLGDLG